MIHYYLSLIGDAISFDFFEAEADKPGQSIFSLGETEAMAADKNAFVWEDPFLIENQLSEDERMVRDGAAAFAADKLAPRIEEAYLEEKTDAGIFREMGEAGLLGITIPEEYGGLGANYVTYGLVAREVERVDSGYRSMMSVQSSLVMYPIHAYGSEAQRKKYLPKLASRRMDRLLRPDRAGCRLRSGRHEDAGREDGERLQDLRLENVDLQRADRRRVRRLGEAQGRERQGRNPRLRAGKGHEGAFGAEDRRQAVAAGVDHRRGGDGRRRSRRRRAAAQRQGPWRPVRLPQPRPLRHFLGRHGRGRGLLAPRAAVWPRPQAVRQAAGRHAAVPEEARRHADRDRAWACRARCASGG